MTPLEGALERLNADYSFLCSIVISSDGQTLARVGDPRAAGGPVRALSTEGVRITTKGVDAVANHLSRFGHYEPNAGMIAIVPSQRSGEAMTSERSEMIVCLVLDLVQCHDGQWGWYQVDRALTLRGTHGVHVPTIMERLLIEGLVSATGDANLASTRYTITEAGRSVLRTRPG